MKKKERLLKRLGENIRKTRKEKRLTQEQLAEKADINPKFLGEVERAETNVSVLTLSKICDALGISVCEILAFTSMDMELLKRGELSTEIWGLIRQADPKDTDLGIRVFGNILEGIQSIRKAKK